jgi:hypothetical protein
MAELAFDVGVSIAVLPGEHAKTKPRRPRKINAKARWRLAYPQLCVYWRIKERLKAGSLGPLSLAVLLLEDQSWLHSLAFLCSEL